MKWEKLDAPDSGYTQLIRLGDVWIGRCKVMYGYRLRIGIMRDLYSCCDKDLCCGLLQKNYNWLLIRAMKIIEADRVDEIPPQSNIKPYMQDEQFLEYIDDLYRECKSLGVAKTEPVQPD